MNEMFFGREKPQTIISILCVLSQQHIHGTAHSELTHFIPPNAKFISSLPILISHFSPKPYPVVRINERTNFMAYTEFSIAFFVLMMVPYSV
jgi:hypothetical protein